jgi:hypothetical protein
MSYIIMNQIIIIIFIVIVIVFGLLLYTKDKNHKINENFYFKSIPVVNNVETCKRRCDNTAGCETYHFDEVTGKCVLTQFYKLGDIYYPYVNYDYMWRPSKYEYKKHK